MSKHIDETKRRFCKVAGLAGAALMLDLPGSLRQAAATEVPGKGAEKRASGERPITFRDAVERLKRSGDVVSVKRPVDPKYEMGALLWQNEQKGKATRFENVRGRKIPAVGGIYQSWERIGLALGVTGRFGQPGMYSLFQSAMAKPILPQEVSTGPVKEVLLKGAHIDLSTLPIPTLFEGDGAPYITAGVGICRNPETKAYNIGVYRMQLVDKDQILVWAFPGSDLHAIYKAYEKMGTEMDFAVAIGTDPAVFVTAVSKVPTDIDEMSVAGALTGAAVKVTKCETVDLLVPAATEILLEGKIDPKKRTMDGPFADHGGIYKGNASPTLRVTAITHRRNPLFHVVLAGDSMEHCTTSEILACFWGRNMLDHLQSRIEGVKDVHLSWHGGTKKWAIVSLSKKRSAAEPQEIITEIFNLTSQRYAMLPVSSFLRAVIVVDDDVDIYDAKEVLWAVGTRLADSTVLQADKAKGFEIRIGLDATKPMGAAPDKDKHVRTKPMSL